MRVLVTGAYGFIGSHVVAALVAAGHEPVLGVRESRRETRFPSLTRVACDFGRDLDPSIWRPRLAGIEAVVNCAGILRQHGADTFEHVHVAAPRALYSACAEAGVRRVIQISALGEPADGEFVASKHRSDAELLLSGLAATVLRPSLVYSTEGSYGGSTLLRSLAALPWVPLPEAGKQRVRPISAQDVGAAVVAALARSASAGSALELVGPETLSLRDYLAQWRGWLGLGPARFLRLPRAVARTGAWLGERIGRGPLGLTMWRMLERGNVGADDALLRMREQIGLTPQRLSDALAVRPAQSADRWHARLHFQIPLLSMILAGTWIASGVLGFCMPSEQVIALLAPAGVSASAALGLAWGGSVVDLLLGILLLAGWAPRLTLALMAFSVLAYTGFIGVALPSTWVDPFGGLLKNFVILSALGIAYSTAERS